MSTTPASRPLALVTGASSGIARELATQFAEHDFDLIVTAEDDGIQAAAAELRTAGAEVQVAQVDLTTPDGVEHLWQHVAPAAAVSTPRP